MSSRNGIGIVISSFISMFILVYLDYEILNYFSSRKLATDLR